jgi:hypothetical protein
MGYQYPFQLHAQLPKDLPLGSTSYWLFYVKIALWACDTQKAEVGELFKANLGYINEFYVSLSYIKRHCLKNK